MILFPTFLAALQFTVFAQMNTTTPGPINITISTDPLVASCIGKLRIATTVDQNFTTIFERFISSGRIDRLGALLLDAASNICNLTEVTQLQQFLHSYNKAYDIIDTVVANFSNAERDQLNTMENLKDTEAEHVFYLSKFNSLPIPDYQELLRSYNEIMQTVMAAPLDPQLALAVLSLNSTSGTLDERISKDNITDPNIVKEVKSIFRSCC